MKWDYKITKESVKVKVEDESVTLEGETSAELSKGYCKRFSTYSDRGKGSNQKHHH
jgi:hypothetical protein